MLVFCILESRITVRIMTVLKPQDILVLLKLVALGQRPWSYSGLAVSLGMSPSQLHSAVRRALAAQLAVKKGDMITPHIRNLEEFVVHGLRYAFAKLLGSGSHFLRCEYEGKMASATNLHGRQQTLVRNIQPVVQPLHHLQAEPALVV